MKPHRWEQFVDELTGGDRKSIEALRWWLGAQLLGVEPPQLVLAGSGLGKTTAAKVLQEVVISHARDRMENQIACVHDRRHPMAGSRVVILCDNQPARKNPRLLSSLRREAASIVEWAMPPRFDPRDKREILNPIDAFIEEECCLGAGCRVKPADLFMAYRDWCVDNGLRAMSRTRFYSAVCLHCPGVVRERTGLDRQRVFRGIGVKGET